MPPIKRKGPILCSGTPNRNGRAFTDHLQVMVDKLNEDALKNVNSFTLNLNDPNIPLATRKALKFVSPYGSAEMSFSDILGCEGNCERCETLDTCRHKPSLEV